MSDMPVWRRYCSARRLDPDIDIYPHYQISRRNEILQPVEPSRLCRNSKTCTSCGELIRRVLTRITKNN